MPLRSWLLPREKQSLPVYSSRPDLFVFKKHTTQGKNHKIKEILFTTVTMTPLQSGETVVDCWTGFAISTVEEAIFSEGPVLPCESEFPVLPAAVSALELFLLLLQDKSELLKKYFLHL